MNKTLIAAAAAAVTLIAAPAMAQDLDSYMNLGYSVIDADGADLGAGTIRVGTTWRQYFGVELEASLGVVNDGPAGGEVEMDQSAAIYAVGHLPVGENFEVMARAGWGRAKYSVGTAAATDSSFNYGVAAQFTWDENNGVRADWTRHEFEDFSLEADVYSLSYVRKF